MKGEKVLGARFHIGVMTGGKVHSSVSAVDERTGYQLEMWPMGLLMTGTNQGKPFRTLVSYNNVIAFDLDPAAVAKPEAPVAPPAPQAKAQAPTLVKKAK